MLDFHVNCIEFCQIFGENRTNFPFVYMHNTTQHNTHMYIYLYMVCEFSGLDTIEIAMGRAAGQKSTCDEIFHLNFHEKPIGADTSDDAFLCIHMHAYARAYFDTLSTL